MKKFILLFLLVGSALGAEGFSNNFPYHRLTDGRWINGEFLPNRTLPEGFSEVAFFSYWNEYRKENGLFPVYALEGLKSCARISAEVCANAHDLDHELYNGWEVSRWLAVTIKKVPHYVAENLLFHSSGQFTYEEKHVLRMWQNSPGHNEMLLEENIYLGAIGGIEMNGKRYYALLAIDDLYPIETLTREGLKKLNLSKEQLEYFVEILD